MNKKPYIVLASFLALDQAAKWYALKYLVYPKVITPFLTLEVVMNRGISWGMLSFADNTLFYVLSSFVMAIIVLFAGYVYRRIQLRSVTYGEVIALAGALSNCVDRIAHSGVVDFITFHYSHWYFPTFNIADIGIVLGIIGLIFQDLRQHEHSV